ncbi:DinB family protein [Hymenobacter jeollabukensis]|uniref:DinB family protein n=1 Tax=Hymenobacter jeollabukensis TaxID=2025313 RepID=A0A5R8WPH5_9BACT|nr:DinB family protein [Hymenobacter jeollabukensis]TLM91876.1 DinB family protein [Hymenobacter jeollabukensis]
MSELLRPEPGTYPPYFDIYISRVATDIDPLDMLSVQPTALHQLLAGVTEEQATLRYAPGKWSIKQVVLHLADAERIFAYRALRFARADEQELPGFAENSYAEHSGADDRTLASLLAEYAAVRQATLALFHSFTPEQLQRGGTANGRPSTVRALLYILAGHEAHHAEILAERYLPLITAEA